MQTVGIFLLSIGIWVAYCGVYGVPPISTLAAIIRNPDQFRQIIADAKQSTLQKYGTLFSTTGLMTSGSNPFSQYKISDNWAAHKARGSAGGTDYEMPVGTPIPAVFAGVVTTIPNDGSGGNVLRVKRADGWQIEFMHLSKYLTSSGQTVNPTTIVGLSGGAKGAEGSGSSTGPHLHVDMIDPSGTRQDWEKFIAGQLTGSSNA